jgi:hypothetical protein
MVNSGPVPRWERSDGRTVHGATHSRHWMGPVHAGIGQVSRLTGDLAPTLVPAPVGKMYRTPSPAEATLTEKGTPTIAVATPGANRAQRGRSRKTRIFTASWCTMSLPRCSRLLTCSYPATSCSCMVDSASTANVRCITIGTLSDPSRRAAAVSDPPRRATGRPDRRVGATTDHETVMRW